MPTCARSIETRRRLYTARAMRSTAGVVTEPSERLPEHADVVIDSPRFSHVKRKDDGRIDFVSPLPCPFNYGSVPGTRSGDGERIDAVVLGARLARRTCVRVRVHGLVRFIDDGVEDPKWICSRGPLRARDRVQLAAFFHVYALAKRALNHARGKRGATRYAGLALR
jgi:inorganic pyrophosphatase